MLDVSPALQGTGAALTALLAALAIAPVAIAFARRAGLYDAPGGWKEHAGPTPYLGGAVVLAAGAVGAALFADGPWPVPVVLATLALAAIGTIDDALKLHAWPRVLVEIAAGTAAWEAGVGWELTGIDALDLGLTVLWVFAVVNAFNLLDLMDGVAGATICASAGAIGAIAAIDGAFGLFAGCLALIGACLGFLRHNLARPSRIFLGDGGSMPIGFLAAVAASAVLQDEAASAAVPAALLLFAVPLFDSAYRALLRIRRGVPLLTAGPDSLTNRLLDRVGNVRLVVALVAGAQVLAGVDALITAEGSALGGALTGGVLVALALIAARNLALPWPEPQPSLKTK